MHKESLLFSDMVDVVVVGAGISGLRTALLLKEAGKSVLVLEANDRVGGRTKGEMVGNDAQVVQYDIGGQWVGPTQDRMYKLLEHYSLEIIPQFDGGLPYTYLKGVMRSFYTNDIPGMPIPQLVLVGLAAKYIDYLAWQVPVEAPWSAPRAQEWDSYSLESWMRGSYWASCGKVKETIDIISWALLSTEPSRVSFLWFLWFVHQNGGIQLLTDTKGGAQQDKIIGGAVQLSQKMAEELGDNVKLSSPVSMISQKDETCSVQLEDGTVFQANKVVVATSPTMAGRIRFLPSLPGTRDALFQGHLMGHVIKTITFYEEPFWIQQGYSGEGVSDKNVRLTFDASYPDKNIYALVGFFLGDSALKWCEATKEERKAVVVEHFTTLFGPKAANSTHYIENNWPAEPYVRGAYMSIPPPNILTTVGPAIRQPVGNVHFAGTETAIEWSGYMEGALQAAERVSSEILQEGNAPTKSSFNTERRARNDMLDYSSGNKFTWKRTMYFTAFCVGAYYAYKQYLK